MRILTFVVIAVLGCSTYLMKAHAEEEEGPTSCPFTNESFYVNGSGIRVRKENLPTSAVVGLLKRNTTIYKENEANDENQRICWQEKVFGSGDKEYYATTTMFPPSKVKFGWIPKKFISAKPESIENIRKKIATARAQKDYSEAVRWTESLVDISTGTDLIEAMKQLQVLVSLSGDSARAKELDKKLQQMRTKGLDRVIAAQWFFTKFGDTTPSFEIPQSSAVSDSDLEEIFKQIYLSTKNSNEILKELRSGSSKDPSESIDELQKSMFKLLAKTVYPATLQKKGLKPVQPKWSKKNLDRLSQTDLMARVYYYNPEFLPNIPVSKLRTEKNLQEIIIRSCNPNINFRKINHEWREFPKDILKQYFTKIFSCLETPEDKVALTSIAGLDSDKVFALGFIKELMVRRNVEDLALFYGSLSPALRADFEIMNTCIMSGANIYRFMPLEIKKKAPKIDWAITTKASCSDIMAVRPNDPALLNRLIQAGKLKVDLACLKVIDLGLKEQQNIALLVVTNTPESIKHLGPKMQMDIKVMEASLQTSENRDQICYIDYAAKIKDITVKRRIANLNYQCLNYFAPADFYDPAIKKILYSGKVSYEVARILPKEFDSDPDILSAIDPAYLFSLDDRPGVETVYNFYHRFNNLSMANAAFQKLGLQNLSELSSCQPDPNQLGEYDFAGICKNTDKAICRRALEVALEKNFSGTMKASCVKAVAELNSYRTGSIFGCNFSSKTLPDYFDIETLCPKLNPPKLKVQQK